MSLTVVNGTALVGVDLEPLEGAVIEIVDGTIASVESGGSGSPRREMLDAGGRYILPGLIDWHVHLDLDPVAEPITSWRRPAAERGRTIALNALRSLRGGVTTVRDLGSADHSVLEFRRSVLNGAAGGVAPRILASGRMIVMTGGHANEVGRIADGADQVREAAREQLHAGADVIKVMASGGFSTPGDPNAAEYTVEELRAAVAEARRAGVTVAAHSHANAGVLAALEAGVDTIEHGGLLQDDGVAALAASSAALVPTLRAMTAPISDPRVQPEIAAAYGAALPRYRHSIKSALDSGVSILAGTDAGTYLNDIGGLVDELEQYVDLGASADSALRSATTAGDRTAGKPIGRIEAGWAGDLVVVDDDPVNQIAALRAVHAVVADGTVVDLPWIEQTLARYAPEARGA